jgi:hypothetical protein
LPRDQLLYPHGSESQHFAKCLSALDAYLWNRISKFDHWVGEKFCREYRRSLHNVRVDDTGPHGDYEDPFISVINGNCLFARSL